jgi:hypothetical protein
MNKTNNCGSCTLCCELLPIKELKKPASVLCSNCTLGKGCNIYSKRPESCRNFDCLYIQSDEMDISLRPNECGVMFEKVTTKIYFGTELPKKVGSWKELKLFNYIKSLNDKGISIVISSFSNTPNKFFLAEGHKKEIVEKIIIREYEKLN